MKRLAAIALCVIVFAVLAATVSQLPPMGSMRNPTYTYIIDRYLQKGPEEAGAPNVVTDVILNYRGYDTLGEVTVIFTALIAVLATLLLRPGQEDEPPAGDAAPRSVIVQFVTRAMAPFIAVFTLYLILHGHMSPGGGFQGGTILGALIILLSLNLGRRYGRALLPPKPRPLLQASAVITFIVIGLAGMALYGGFLVYPAAARLEWLREVWLIAVEIGIGLGGASIVATLFWGMEAEA